MANTESFFTDLRTFTDFAKLGDDAHYEDLPLDWFVVISDVRGSTKAIEQGRYQDVNMLGAASIAVLGNLWKDNGVPFVFGGDGASILVPPSRVEAVSNALLQLKNLAMANYDLELRVGVVPMKEVAEQGLAIQVAKFKAGEAKSIAFMRGGGLSWADGKIKSNPDRYCLKNEQVGILKEVKDLSCRWNPMKSRKGQVLSILVRSTTNDLSIFPSILDHLRDTLDGDVQMSSPVHQEAMQYKSIWAVVRNEMKLTKTVFQKSFLQRFGWVIFSVLSIKYGLKLGFDARRYESKIPSHSDYRKFDDMLRLVIDCTPVQAKTLRAYFETLYRNGHIFFGIHQSDHAIMTCLVGSTNDGDHIHFIDGGSGGYAMAAKELKDQIAKAALQSRDAAV